MCDVTRHTYLPGCCSNASPVPPAQYYTRPHLASKLVVYVMFPGSGRVRGSTSSSRPQSQHPAHSHASIPYCIIALHHHPFSQSSVPSLQGAARKTTKILTLRFDEFFFSLNEICAAAPPPRTQYYVYKKLSFG